MSLINLLLFIWVYGKTFLPGVWLVLRIEHLTPVILPNPPPPLLSQIHTTNENGKLFVQKTFDFSPVFVSQTNSKLFFYWLACQIWYRKWMRNFWLNILQESQNSSWQPTVRFCHSAHMLFLTSFMWGGIPVNALLFSGHELMFNPTSSTSIHYFFFLSQRHEWITMEKLGAWHIESVHSAKLEKLIILEVQSRIRLITMFFLKVS